jgi:uncharacterized protein with FMN-binding domain
VSPRGRHVAGWTLALAACAGAVAARVLVGEDHEPLTLGALPVERAAPARVRTVTRTHTVVVTTPGPTRTVRTAAPRVQSASPATATRVSARPRPRPRTTAVPRRARPAPSPQRAEGDAVPTRYGPVQVRLVLRGTRILDVVVLQDPDDLQRSREIDADALPKLRAQVLAAQSAGIDGVSGATYTSRGYEQSVQSALDLA